MKVFKALILLTVACGAFSAFGNSRFDDVTISATQVNNNVYVLYGAGGNIGVLTGKDGVLLVDDQFEPLAAKIEAALQEVNPGSHKVKFVVNTHYHGDHTGSNVYFAKSASILAHENVRKRLSVKSDQGLPVITYNDGVKLHLNGETVDVRHLSKGHTDGDSVIHFKKANVWHLGDLFFANRFPYIDIKSGGSVDGAIANLETLLSWIDEEAKIIPGHGDLTNKAGLQTYLNMIKETRHYVRVLEEAGNSKQRIIELGLPDKWQSWGWQFINEERWISTLYQGK